MTDGHKKDKHQFTAPQKHEVVDPVKVKHNHDHDVPPLHHTSAMDVSNVASPPTGTFRGSVVAVSQTHLTLNDKDGKPLGMIEVADGANITRTNKDGKTEQIKILSLLQGEVVELDGNPASKVTCVEGF